MCFSRQIKDMDCLFVTYIVEGKSLREYVKCFSDAFTSRGLYIYSTAHIALKKRTSH